MRRLSRGLLLGLEISEERRAGTTGPLQFAFQMLDRRGPAVLHVLCGGFGGFELLIPFGICPLAVRMQLRSFGADDLKFCREAIKPILNLRCLMRRLSRGLLLGLE